MCSESDPAKCHRSKLIGVELLENHSISVKHIISCKEIKTQEEVMRSFPLPLFDDSTESYSRKTYYKTK